jgi:2Fe-2S ferredoxin
VAQISAPPSTVSQDGHVSVEPGGARFDVRPGESVIQAAWRAGYQWPTTCWGQAECGVCAMEILEGREFLVAPDKVEEARLRSLPRRDGGNRRLACQTRVVGGGSLTVRKPGVRLRATEAPPPSSSPV